MQIPRMGSSVSTKMLARAAVEGRRLHFRLTPSWLITGYLVGMDDFHWIIVGMGEDLLRLQIIHKSVPAVEISDARLNTEPEEVVKKVTEIGQSFWSYCEKSYLGRNGEQ
jgi:hypothetical protein